MYSALVIEAATVGCRQPNQLTAPPLKMKTYSGRASVSCVSCDSSVAVSHYFAASCRKATTVALVPNRVRRTYLAALQCS
jgi:hypothetical protein